MPSIRLILTLFVLVCSLQSWGQSLYFRGYGVKEGLSGNSVTAILQDRKGFMWFGTRNGLNRFDGTSFRIFRNNPPDSLSLGSNSVGCLFEDEAGCIWVGTHKGVYLYDPKKEAFSPFKKLPAVEIRSIVQDQRKNLWIIAGRNVYRYSPATRQVNTYEFADQAATTLRLSSTGDLWTGTNKGTLKKFDGNKNIFVNYTIASSNSGQSNIRDIYPLSDSTLLVGMLNQVLIVNVNTGRNVNAFRHFTPDHDIKVRHIFRRSDSIYWIGSESGLYTLNIKNGEGRCIQKDPQNPHSITDNVIFSIAGDTEGGTWVGTFYGGVNYYSPQYNKFQKYVHHSGLGTGFRGNIVHEIVTDKRGNIWVGTEDAGLNKIDSVTGNVKNFSAGKIPGSITYNKIHGLLAVENELWIGTLDRGLDVMDLGTEKVIRHYDAGTDSNSLKSDFIVSIYKSRSGDVLIGTRNGMFKYNRPTDNFTLLSPVDMHIQSMFEDEKHTIWMGTYGKGIYYFNPVTNTSGKLRHAANTPNSLINDYVNSVFEDRKRNLWFCTEEGLSKFDPHTKQFRNYTTADGLPDNQVFRVLEDDAGYVWITTSHGLVQMNPGTESFKKFGTSSGLISEQFNYNSSLKKGSTLFFGTIKGLIGFNPAEFIPSEFIPPVYITDLQINNKSLNLRDLNSPLKESITFSNRIILDHNQSDLSFNVAALSFAAPEKNEYQYKLEGVNQEWIHIKENRTIFYTKLPPGNYTFRVKGSNGNEFWNPRETRLDIVINPPWWRSTGAFVIYAILVLGMIGVIVRYYHLAMKEKHRRKMEAFEIEKEREIYHAKIEFFTNVTHEIRTPLTLIKLPIDQLMKKDIADEDIKAGLNMINKNTNRLIDLSNQLLDFRKAEANKYSLNFIKSNVSALLSEEFKNFRLAAEQKGLQFRLELCRIEPHAYLDPEAFRKILTNLISNAIKYASTVVVVKLLPFGSEDDLLHIEFRNDGDIIPTELKDRIFEPFFRINESGKESGTGIGLPLAKSLAELHKGSLVLKQPDGNINTFVLSLPVEQAEMINLDNLHEPIEDDQMPGGNAETDDASSDRPSILLVEDNREILSFLQKSLHRSYKIYQALNGMQALEILQKENITLVVSDVMMPVMDGIELCREIKSDLQYSHVPIILLTAKNTLESKITGLEVGADAYIEKPFALEHLQAQITNLISNRDKVKEYFASSPLAHLKGIACSKPDKEFLDRLNGFIQANLGVVELDVDQLSVLMNMSRSTLYRKIKALSNLAPNELITLSRLKKAAELLRDGYKVSEVAGVVGYSLQSNFSRDFHKQFGLSPTNYVKSLQTGSFAGDASL